MISILQSLESLCKKHSNFQSTGRFEWVNSLLVEAVKNGHWLLISHANFCRYLFTGTIDIIITFLRQLLVKASSQYNYGQMLR